MSGPIRVRTLLLPLALCGLAAAPYVPWQELSEADWIYALATRTSTLDGHAVHYPTPTQELAEALAGQAETPALRHLAEARLELGDRPGALQALERWAAASGPEAWAETARWCASHDEWVAAFRAAASALPNLAPAERRKLADEQVRWADAQPDFGDALVLRQRRAELFPEDSGALEDWLSALEEAGRLAEVEAGLAKAKALREEARLAIRSDLLFDHGDKRKAFELLDAALDPDSPSLGFGSEWLKLYVARVDAGNPGAPETWRAALERGFDPRALVRLASYFQGQERGDAALDLLRQVERRNEATLDRRGWLQLARHFGEIDAVPEAFRCRLAAAQKASSEDQQGDLAALVRLALRAGGRALPWGVYNDEPYRWVARLDRTPGFWTGGVAFLLTGQDWQEALLQLEAEALPERTFKTARLLLDELASRAPSSPDLPMLRALVMARHVERGEGQQALQLLPLVETGPPEAQQLGRRTALLAMRQVEVPVAEELRLYKAQLRLLAPDGSQPDLGSPGYVSSWIDPSLPQGKQRFLRHRSHGTEPSYQQLLDEAQGRLDERDATHRASLDLLLGELDRLPDAQDLWGNLSERIASWNLDDELGPRYESALRRFGGPAWWQRLARWYTRRSRHAELRKLADELVQRFRASELFARAEDVPGGVEIPEQPRVGQRVRLVPWADWVRLKALERFPHSPSVYRQALAHLSTPTRAHGSFRPSLGTGQDPVMTDDALFETRRYALLFTDTQERGAYLALKMRGGGLAGFLEALEAQPLRTPVEERLLFDGWTRLSQFERAAQPADRLSAAYPGDGDLAGQALTLHRSLSTLDPAHAAPARAVVERVLPALSDPSTLITELGELEQERGRGDAAQATWARLVTREPKNPTRVEELATILWDYGYMRPALETIEQGRQRLKQPWLLAFEAGVLREELHDIDGAVREYLASAKPNRAQCFCDWFETDQRALRRLSQLAARERVRTRLLERIAALQPGLAKDEQALVALLPLPTIQQPDASLDATVDDWIDAQDQPNDPLGRSERREAREQWLPQAREAMTPIGDALLTRVLLMSPKASNVELLDKLAEWRSALLDGRWAKDREVDFDNTLLKRRAELLPSEEQRVAKEVERARFLLERGRRAEGDALWAALAPRIDALPQGAPRMRAEAERVAYVERTRGVDAAAGDWRALQARYPWSRGLLEDRLAFLNRNGRGAEARQTLAEVAPRAAAGHRESLLERLAREALEARDLPMARRAVEGLMAENTLAEGQRLGALHLLARLRLRESDTSDLLALAKAEAPKLPAERLPDVYEQLARAADAEKQFGAAQALWIEALNRRLEREWLKAAYRSAERASSVAELRAFFERQRERSPRDVRWAVAVRELRVLSQDLEGAIEMAKTAVAVRPERESLWREAVELIERAGRPAEAADYLAGWNEPRAADEGVAGWRSGLYARAGLDDRALAIEKATLAAFERQYEAQPKGETDDLGERRLRAARRLIGAGLPQKAWKLLCPTDDPASLAETSMPAREQAELALTNSRFVRLLRAHAGADDEDFRSAAASAFDGQARPEQREELLTFIKSQLFPATAGARAWPGQAQALALYWPFAEQAGVREALRDALARRFVATQAGPWNPDPPLAFIEAVGHDIVDSALRFESPELDRLWVRHLAERDRAEELGSFLSVRWSALLTKVFADTPVRKDELPKDWTRYLDEPGTLALFARALGAQPERLAELQRIFAERKRWDRLWALGARGWNVAPLLTALPNEGRQAWFRLWLNPSPSDADPVLKARGETLEAATLAVGRLVTGAPQAPADPLIARLRGPRTIGDVLGSDPGWLFPEFTPRALVSGRQPDEGEARVVGRAADTGRLPGILWGDRPGNAWYVLETLARYREGNADAALVPLEVRERGREAERTRLAARLADALGDNDLALEIEGQGSITSLDLLRFESQLRRMLLGGARPAAENALREELRRRQPRLDEVTWRALRRLAEDLSLPPAFELLSRDTPVAAALLAQLHEQHGAVACAGLKPADAVAFRSALGRRWTGRERTLPAADLRFWLDELWATGSNDSLPRAGLTKLGGLFPAAADWLATLPQPVRAEGLAALQALPNETRLEALLATSSVAHEDVVRLLRVRVRLAKGDEAGALELFEDLLAELKREPPLTYAAVSLSEAAPADEGEAEGQWSEESADSEEAPSADPLSARLSAWVQPFRVAGKQALVAEQVEALLAERRQDGGVPLPAWRLALELATPARQTTLLAELERAYVRGELQASHELGELVVASAPTDAPRWLKRWAEDFAYEGVAKRANLLARLKDPDAAARTLITGRQKGKWTASEEVRAFDLWRRIAPEPKAGAKPPVTPPATWVAARPFWKRKPGELQADLGRHLAQHPLDVLSARAVLRSAAPADEQSLRLAQSSLRSGTLDKLGNSWADARFVQLRVARSLLPSSPRAALRQLGNAVTDEPELRRRALPRAEIVSALLDVARIALGAGDAARTETAMAALEDRDAGEAARLRASASSLRPATPLVPYRVDANGQPQPLRPRDLDWPVLAAVLAEEPKR